MIHAVEVSTAYQEALKAPPQKSAQSINLTHKRLPTQACGTFADMTVAGGFDVTQVGIDRTVTMFHTALRPKALSVIDIKLASVFPFWSASTNPITRTPPFVRPCCPLTFADLIYCVGVIGSAGAW